MDIALDGRRDDRPGALAGPRPFRLEVGDEHGDGLLHDPGALDDLGKEHPAGPEEVADDVHPGHQRALDHVERARRHEAGLFGVVDDERIDAGDEGMGQALLDRSIPPREILGGPLHPALAGVAPGQLEQPFRRVGSAVEDDVLYQFAQLRLDLVVDRQDASVDDGHVEARCDRVVQEDRVDRLAHAVVAAERERHVRHAAGGSRSGELHLQPLDGLNERDGVGVVFFHTRGDREDVCVEDDVLRLEADDVGQQVVRPPQDGDPALDRLGLTPLVEGHDDDRRSVTPAEASLAQELGLALLERDRVDDTLALELPKAGLDDRELRAVDHDGDGRDVGLGGNPPKEAGHRSDAVEHRLIHVHVDQLCAIGDLLAGDVDRLVLGAGCDEPGELARAGHVRPLADVDEGVARRRDD